MIMVRTIAVGVGYRHGTAGEEIVALVEQVLAMNRIDAASVIGIGTAEQKRGDPAIMSVAAHFGVDAHFFATGMPAVAEPAALALAGPGARLIAAKVKSERVTCALAVPA